MRFILRFWKKNNYKFPLFIPIISLLQLVLYSKIQRKSLLILLGYDAHRLHEVWRFITIIFVHPKESHLMGNLSLQIVLGLWLEIHHGWRRTGIIYISAAVGDSLFAAVLCRQNYAGGASGAISALPFFDLSSLIFNWSRLKNKWADLTGTVLWIIFSLWVLESNELHVGGVVVGFLVSNVILSTKSRRKSKIRKVSVFCLFIIMIGSMSFIIGTKIITSRYPSEYWNFNYNNIRAMLLNLNGNKG